MYMVCPCLVALGGVLGSIVRADGVDPVSGKLCMNRGGELTPAHMTHAVVASVRGRFEVGRIVHLKYLPLLFALFELAVVRRALCGCCNTAIKLTHLRLGC